MSVKYEIVVKTGEYNGKAQWQKVGVVLESEKGLSAILEPWFNPAGIASANNGKCYLNLFTPKAKTEAQSEKKDGLLF